METFIYEEKISPKICDGLIKLFNNTHDKKKGEVGYPAVVVAKRKKCTEAYYKPLPYHPYLKALEKVITNYKKKYSRDSMEPQKKRKPKKPKTTRKMG